MLFSMVAVPIYIPTIRVGEFPFFSPHPFQYLSFVAFFFFFFFLGPYLWHMEVPRLGV